MEQRDTERRIAADRGAEAGRIRAYLAGDDAAFRQVDGWIRTEIARRYPVLRGEIEDLCQATHEKLVAQLRHGRFRHRSRLRTYVAGIAHHTAIDRIRKLHRERDLTPEWSGSGNAAPNPYESLASLQERQLLHQVVLRSSPACRALWRMVFLERLSYAEIARRLSIPPGTVKSRMWNCRRRALRILQRLRRARGVRPPSG